MLGSNFFSPMMPSSSSATTKATVLRTSPCFLSPSLQEYDSLLMSTVSSIANIHFEDPAWSQAILPVRSGGLGIRSAVQLAPSAFLASAAACSELITHILPPHLSCSTSTPHQDEALSLWSRGHDTPPPEGTARYRQKAWDSVRVVASVDNLLEDAPDMYPPARLLAASSRESGV